MIYSELEERARIFATAAHAAIDHRRKYTQEPYIVHPAAVVEILRTVRHTQEMIAAAWMHDVVEDTKVGLHLIDQEFGGAVAELVWWLTDLSVPEDGNRAARKAIDREHNANAPPSAQTVRMADLIHNTKSIVEHDPEFARTYVREKELLLDVLTKADPALIAIAKMQLEEYTGIIH